MHSYQELLLHRGQVHAPRMRLGQVLWSTGPWSCPAKKINAASGSFWMLWRFFRDWPHKRKRNQNKNDNHFCLFATSWFTEQCPAPALIWSYNIPRMQVRERFILSCAHFFIQRQHFLSTCLVVWTGLHSRDSGMGQINMVLLCWSS